MLAVKESDSLRKEAAVSGGMTADTSVSFDQQHGEQAVAWVGIVF